VKRIAMGVLALLALLVAALLVAPSFIDWANYRDTFEVQLANATGREVGIEGDVALTLLPRPAFQVDGVRISNPTGAVNPDFAVAGRVAVNLAFGPLLTGRIQFTSIDIVSPFINAEVLEDGTTTWALVPTNTTSQSSDLISDGAANFDLGIDNLRVSGGTVRYFDARTGDEQTVTEFNLDLRAESVAGPFDATGEATVAGLPWQLGISGGEIRDNRPRALVIAISNSEIGLSSDFSGTLSMQKDGPVVSGRLSSSGENLSNVLRGFGLIENGNAIPLTLREDFRVELKLNATDSSIDAESINFRIGASSAKGTGRYSWADDGEFSLNISAARLDLEAWKLGQLEDGTRFTFGLPFISAKPSYAQDNNSFALPLDIKGTVDVGINLVEWHGQVMRNARLSASLEKSEITLAEAGIDLPGNTTLVFSGFVKAQDGFPVFDMNGDMASRDVRTLLDWLDAAPPLGMVPPSRLNSLSVSTHFRGTPSRLDFDVLDVVLDTTQLKGSAAIEIGQSLKTALDLSVSNLDLDSYLPAIRDQFLLSTDQQSGEPDTDDSSLLEINSSGTNPLDAIEADIKLGIGALTVGGNIFRSVAIDVLTEQGTLVIRNGAVDDFAGASLSVSGTIRNVTAEPQAENLSIAFSSGDFSRVSRALNLDLPRLGFLEGEIAAQAKISGTLSNATVDVSANAGALALVAAGAIQNVLGDPIVNLDTRVSHEQYQSLMRSLGFVMPQGMPMVGPVSVSTKISGTGQNLKLRDVVAQVGPNAVLASIDYDAGLERSKISGSVSMAAVDFDQLFPPDPTDQLARASRGRSERGGTSISSRWMDDPIDLSALANVDADLTFTADRLRVKGFDADQFSAQVNLSSGTLSIPEWEGNLYGGPATGAFNLIIASPIEIQTSLTVTDAQLGRLGGALAISSEASGKAALQGQFSARGVSQRDLVSSLTGQGRLTATGIDANSGGEGFAFAAVLAPVKALSQLGGVFGGGVTQGLATMGAEFTLDQGVVTLSNAALQSNVYSGAFTGIIDLPRWWIDVEGRVRLEVNLITQLLGNRLQMPSLIPLAIRGPLDLPNVNMDTSGGAVSSQPSDPTATEAPQQPRKPNPADLFQGILNEITKPR
jgi:uncharacterized protein involved in outer membrane biogenesis